MIDRVSFSSITSFEAARDFIGQRKNHLILFDTWIPERKFIELLHSNGGISIYREDETPVAFCLGENPPIRADWKELNLERESQQEIKLESNKEVEWDTYFIELENAALKGEPSKNRLDEEIEKFLRDHAPDSSVFPGNNEIVEWARVDESDRLAGVAAICRWESGEYVVASVATHSELRGRGIGTRVMAQVVDIAKRKGISRLCLGVLSQNESAKALYKKAGWKPLFEFTYLELA